MISRLSREEAIGRIRENLAAGECLACALLSGKTGIMLEKNSACSVFLSQFPRTWGQTLVVLNRHAEKLESISETEWLNMQQIAFRMAGRLQKILQPVRINITLMGAAENLPNSCPHLHLNLLPVYDSKLHPKDLYTWEQGVLEASGEEWAKLKMAMTAAGANG